MDSDIGSVSINIDDIDDDNDKVCNNNFEKSLGRHCKIDDVNKMI